MPMDYGASYAGDSFFDILFQYGFIDVIIPFILIFTIIYAIAHKVELLGDDKKIHAVLAGVIALGAILPHMLGVRPSPVTIMYSAIPSTVVWVVGAVMLLIFMGVFGAKTDPTKSKITGIVFIAAIAIIGYIFLQASGIIDGLPHIPLLEDPAMQAIAVIVLVFGLIINYIVGPSGDQSNKTDWLDEAGKFFGKEGT